MGRKSSPEEVSQQIVTAFPEGTGALFYHLWVNVVSLHINWKNYRSLFGTSPERIDVLNKTAASFFSLLDDILRHHVILTISKLTDPPETGKKENASLARLLQVLQPHLEQDLACGLNERISQLKAHCEPLRHLRNRKLAHSDLSTALKYHPEPLPGISRQFIEDALELIRDIMNTLENRFRDSTTYYQNPITYDDAESLIFQLQSALAHEECRRAFLRRKPMPIQDA